MTAAVARYFPRKEKDLNKICIELNSLNAERDRTFEHHRKLLRKLVDALLATALGIEDPESNRTACGASLVFRALLRSNELAQLDWVEIRKKEYRLEVLAQRYKKDLYGSGKTPIVSLESGSLGEKIIFKQ